MQDIHKIIAAIVRMHPEVSAEQLKVTFAADDDGLWFFTQPSCPFEVQFESFEGSCPFLAETDEHDGREMVETVEDAVRLLKGWLHLSE